MEHVTEGEWIRRGEKRELGSFRIVCQNPIPFSLIINIFKRPLIEERSTKTFSNSLKFKIKGDRDFLKLISPFGCYREVCIRVMYILIKRL